TGSATATLAVPATFTPSTTTPVHLPFSYRQHKSGVPALAWSPDGTRLASGGADGTVQIWNAQTGQPMLTYTGHAHANPPFVLGVAWSPDGKRIVSGGDDGSARVWDAGTGQDLVLYLGHHGSVKQVAWSPDGKQIASASADQTVQLWDAATGRTRLTLRDAA